MTKLIVKAGVALASVWFTARLLKEGVTLEGTAPTVIVAILLALINAFVKPILKFLTFPVTMITMGLFPLIINAGLILLVDELVQKGFDVKGVFWAFAFSFVLSVVSWAFDFVTAPLQK
ncbi:phage holin family protein [Microscilla marina]|uniref:Membrane spanning protein n=1 Tax=Microscilla marina ATCC 23134 TaxID=313606 RepID=A1ZW30_MICM2|nr:phage holin family protein [Microscilla marina]EAY25393.1 membrane spanning protein [Microscilla marina ATCC 23134]